MGHFPDTKICQTWNKNNFLVWSFLIFPNMVKSRLWSRYLNTAKLRACFQGERVNLVLKVTLLTGLKIDLAYKQNFTGRFSHFTSLTDVFLQA